MVSVSEYFSQKKIYLIMSYKIINSVTFSTTQEKQWLSYF